MRTLLFISVRSLITEMILFAFCEAFGVHLGAVHILRKAGGGLAICDEMFLG